MVHKKVNLKALSEGERATASTYSTRYFAESVSKYELPEESMPPRVAYQLCHDELNMDGNPALNLATFVTTWMDDKATKLINETLNKNLVDEEEYPQTKELERRCVNMIANLYNAPHEAEAVGTSAIGSSEAIMLAALSHKVAWRERRKALGKPHDKPNIVMSADVQVVWDKFARYFDVEPRIIPMETDQLTFPLAKLDEYVDENTTCVVGVLGTTFTGAYDPIHQMNDALVHIKNEKGWDIPLHVDAASGGFVAPFIHPEYVWDFRLPQVKSINVSGHKYGLVYPGIGWVVWRDRSELPEELIFYVNYLGGEMPTFNLNFSRGGSHVVAQYYNFLHLGRAGYTRIMANLMQVREYLAAALSASGHFTILTPDQYSLPLVTVALRGNHSFTVFDLSAKLRERGWIVPAYTLPPNAEELQVLRIVAREGLSRDMAEILVGDIERAIDELSEAEKRVDPIAGREAQRTGPC